MAFSLALNSPIERLYTHRITRAYFLSPNCLGPGFCLFLKFGQAIVIRVLMLNFLNFL